MVVTQDSDRRNELTHTKHRKHIRRLATRRARLLISNLWTKNDPRRQWKYEFDAKPGEYRIQVRATDKTGETQTQEVSRPDPDGATGYHTRTLKVI